MTTRSSMEMEYVGHTDDDTCSNPAAIKPIGDVIEARLSRRDALKTLALAASGSLFGSALGQRSARAAGVVGNPSSLTFQEVVHACDQDAHVAPGYELQVLLRWGDKVLAEAPAFDPRQQTADAQEQQFGYNCDYIAFLPLPRGATNTTRGLLCVNHEYTDTNLMFPGITSRSALENLPREWVDVEMAAHGHSVVEIERSGNRWHVVPDGRRNRRLTAGSTPMRVSGPAAGHPRLATSRDQSATQVIGTLNNCAGGVTPWGTVLICEENFDKYFSGDPAGTSEERNHRRYGLTGASKFYPAWAKHHERFDIEKEPHEPNRFGWVVEFDPYDPASVPVKRTALGRFKHEGAGIALNHDGRVVVYCGDDERFEYVYKFVTSGRYNPANSEANRDLLDDGILYVARFDEDGTMTWLPLVFGHGPLTPENGFASQADVVIEARRAGDLLGATPMDRPEDVEPSPNTGRVYVILSNNSKRAATQIDAANPRANNEHGHIIELVPPAAESSRHTPCAVAACDHAALKFQWNVFLQCGDPSKAEDAARYPAGVSQHGWLSCPDNSTFDGKGRLWITTDGAFETRGLADGVYACDTTGPGRGVTRQFFSGPCGSEVSGVVLTPDDRTMFVSVQHPGEQEGSDFANPTTRWPDFNPSLPPRPAVVAVTRRDGAEIGT